MTTNFLTKFGIFLSKFHKSTKYKTSGEATRDINYKSNNGRRICNNSDMPNICNNSDMPNICNNSDMPNICNNSDMPNIKSTQFSCIKRYYVELSLTWYYWHFYSNAFLFTGHAQPRHRNSIKFTRYRSIKGSVQVRRWTGMFRLNVVAQFEL